ncbi:MAG: flagellar biosynthesis protein [Candidatus Saccharibacteria bacterium]|nr:flagellar biosynthesis protein [Pseudorhodobacter sp.]
MAVKLEVFNAQDKPTNTQTVILDRVALEDEKLASYDSGYRAGWDDANAAQSEDQTRIRAELARNLQALGFSYHEARTHILKAIEPLMLQIVGRLLPEIARQTLAPIVLETLMPLAEGLGDAPVTLVLNPASRAAVETLVEQATGLPMTIQEEPTLGEGQVYIKLGTQEAQIDLDQATADIAAAVRGFFELPGKDRPNG